MNNGSTRRLINSSNGTPLSTECPSPPATFSQLPAKSCKDGLLKGPVEMCQEPHPVRDLNEQTIAFDQVPGTSLPDSRNSSYSHSTASQHCYSHLTGREAPKTDGSDGCGAAKRGLSSWWSPSFQLSWQGKWFQNDGSSMGWKAANPRPDLSPHNLSSGISPTHQETYNRTQSTLSFAGRGDITWK